jgi:hypothetical protein
MSMAGGMATKRLTTSFSGSTIGQILTVSPTGACRPPPSHEEPEEGELASSSSGSSRREVAAALWLLDGRLVDPRGDELPALIVEPPDERLGSGRL